MVTRRMLPWFGTCVVLGACGGAAESGTVPSASPEPAKQAGIGARAQDPSVGDEPAGMSGMSGMSAMSAMSGMSAAVGGASGSRATAAPMGGATGGSPPSQYPGSGFVVHEWGTDTVVVGSDGSLQRGLHHEQEDLPGFVYDRIKAGTLLGAPSVTIKMETPVTYFYSDVPRTVHASVAFPKGVLTQWYPAATSFRPPIAGPAAIANQPLGYADPVLDTWFPFVSDMCRAKFGTIGSGVLDWGSVSVLPRDANVDAQMPLAALDRFSWSYARNVASNPLQIENGETERFLFYRGLGNFELPVSVAVTGAGVAGLGGNPITLTNHLPETIGSVFMMNVGENEGIFRELWQGIAPGGQLSDGLPVLYGTKPLDDYADGLSAAVTGALDRTGLYHDEAVAMVNTWKHQWFRTKGMRLLYVIPQSWTDASIPLTIEPKPDATLRVMLIRVEVITPEQEAEDVAVLSEGNNDAMLAHFSALGRFAEPRLRRALALSPTLAGQNYLGKMSTANTSVASGE